MKPISEMDKDFAKLGLRRDYLVQKRLKNLSTTMKLFSLLVAFMLLIMMAPLSHGYMVFADDEATTELIKSEGSALSEGSAISEEPENSGESAIAVDPSKTEDPTVSEESTVYEDPTAVFSPEGARGSDGSISGFLWVDGNGMLPTDWDGRYNGTEELLAFMTVYLYAANDLKTPLATTETGINGTYEFAGLPSGSYILGLISSFVSGNEYLLPFLETAENSFAIDWSSNPLMAYTKPITLTSGQVVEDINAGMRRPMGIMPLADSTFSQIWTAGGSPGAEVTLDGRVWYAIKRTTVNNTNVVLLMHKGEFTTTAFGSSTNYNGSTLQSKMTDLYTTNRFPTINTMAVVPQLGTLSLLTAKTEPTSVKANTTSQTTDIFFALSYADLLEYNGNKISPLRAQLKTYQAQYWSRTPASGANLWGIYPKADTFDAGLNPNGNVVGMVPAVWVSVSTTPPVTPIVTLYTIDTDGNPIGTPSFTTHTTNGGIFTMAPSQAPVIEGFEYYQWKNGVSGALQPYNLMIYLTGITTNIDIYLIYKKEPVADVTLSKTIAGDFADKTKTFTFWVYFKDADDNELAQDTSFDYEGGVLMGSGATPPSDDTLTLDSDGKAPITLGHGQKITIKDIPVGLKINIVEDADGNYAVSYTDSDDNSNTSIDDYYTDFVILGEGDRSFDFYNTRVSVPPTGIEDEPWTFAAGLFPLAFFALVGWMLIKYRQGRKWAN